MKKLIKRFRRDEEGAALVEYGLLVGLIAVVCVGVITTLGLQLQNLFTLISNALPAV